MPRMLLTHVKSRFGETCFREILVSRKRRPVKQPTCWLFFFVSLFAAGTAFAGDYSGSYRGDGISVSMQREKGDAYKGSADIGAQSCTFSAEHRAEVGGLPPGYDAPILGKMRCGANEASFSANLLDSGNTLELQIASKLYTLRRTVAPEPANAGGPPAAGRRAVAKFVLEQVLVTDAGNAYSGRLTHSTSARAGLQWVVPQIAGGFDATVVGDGATTPSCPCSTIFCSPTPDSSACRLRRYWGKSECGACDNVSAPSVSDPQRNLIWILRLRLAATSKPVS